MNYFYLFMYHVRVSSFSLCKLCNHLMYYKIQSYKQKGQSLIEYALILVGMAMLIIAGMLLYREEVLQLYNDVKVLW